MKTLEGAAIATIIGLVLVIWTGIGYLVYKTGKEYQAHKTEGR